MIVLFLILFFTFSIFSVNVNKKPEEKYKYFLNINLVIGHLVDEITKALKKNDTERMEKLKKQLSELMRGEEYNNFLKCLAEKMKLEKWNSKKKF